MSIKTIQLNNEALQQLGLIKRHISINKNNIICRWALILSLREPGKIADLSLDFDTGGRGEIAWETFAGEYSSTYLSLLKLRLTEDDIEINHVNLKNQLIQHINRGLGYILGSKKVKSVSDLVALVK